MDPVLVTRVAARICTPVWGRSEPGEPTDQLATDLRQSGKPRLVLGRGMEELIKAERVWTAAFQQSRNMRWMIRRGRGRGPVDVNGDVLGKQLATRPADLDVYRCAGEFLAFAFDASSQASRGNAPILDQLKRAATSVPLNIADHDHVRANVLKCAVFKPVGVLGG